MLHISHELFSNLVAAAVMKVPGHVVCDVSKTAGVRRVLSQVIAHI